jgi:hypothetical protein
VEEEIAEGRFEWSVATAEEKERAACGFAMQRASVVGGGKAAAAPGEDGEGAGDLSADGVDGAEIKALRMVEEGPAELLIAGEDGEG